MSMSRFVSYVADSAEEGEVRVAVIIVGADFTERRRLIDGMFCWSNWEQRERERES